MCKTLPQQLVMIKSPSPAPLLTEEELQIFESKTGLILPEDYKTFCQRFGSVFFDNCITIYRPSEKLLAYSKKSINHLKSVIKEYPSKDAQTDIELQSLLNSAFVFLDNDGTNLAFWDLRTYKQSDKSYDIYWIKCDDFDDEVYKVGRSFSEFILNFCLGRNFYSFLPESMQPMPCHSFTSIQD